MRAAERRLRPPDLTVDQVRVDDAVHIDGADMPLTGTPAAFVRVQHHYRSAAGAGPDDLLLGCDDRPRSVRRLADIAAVAARDFGVICAPPRSPQTGPSDTALARRVGLAITARQEPP